MAWVLKNVSLIQVLRNGFLATLLMEIFYRLTDLFLHHRLDVAAGIGQMFMLQSPLVIRIVGYFVFLAGGVIFSYLYARFIPKRSIWTGLLYGIFFLWLIVDGLLFEPSFIGIDYGVMWVMINFFGHFVYGGSLGVFYGGEYRKSLKSVSGELKNEV